MIIHSSKAAFILCLLTSSTMPVTKSAQNSFYSSTSKEELLFEAIKNNNVKEVRNLIENGANVNSKDEYGAILLHRIIESCSSGILGFPSKKKNRSKVNKNNVSRRNQYFEILKLLIGKGADVNMLDKDGNPPLHLAIKLKNFEVASFLIEKGNNINAENTLRDTVLHHAVRYGDLGLVKFLIVEKGMDVNSEGDDDNTPLHYAVDERNIELAKFLIESGANVNAQKEYGCTPLHLAISNRYFELVKLLVANGASVNHQNQYRCTPLQVAAQSWSLEIVKFLIEKGANVNKDGLLEAAVISGSFEIVKFLLANGANINVYGSANPHRISTLVHYAVESGRLELVKFFVLEKKMNINSKDENGNTPLHTSINEENWENFEVPEFLIKNGADVNAENDEGHTPLHLALSNHYFELIKFLVLEKKMDIRDKDKHGNSLLKRMANNEYYKYIPDQIVDIAVFLVENGVSDGKEFFLKKMTRYIMGESTHSNRAIEMYKSAISYFLANGTDPNKVIDFDSLKSDLKPLLLYPYLYNIKFCKTILDTFYHADHIQIITAGYIRMQRDLEDLYLPQDLCKVISEHTYGKSIPLKPHNFKFLESTLVWLGTMIKT